MEYDKLDLIDIKADKLIQSFKTDEDMPVFINALIFIIVIFIALVCVLYVYKGYPYLIFTLALLVFVPYKLAVNKALSTADNLSRYALDTLDNKAQLTVAKLQYLLSLVQVKKTRVQYLRLAYMVCFPVWLYMLFVLTNFFLKREFTLGYNIAFGLLAIIMGISFWYFYFRNDLELLEEHKAEVKHIISSIHSQP